MLDAEPGGPVPPLPRSSDPHNLAEASRVSLGSQFWQLHALAKNHPSASVRQSAAAVAAMPADGSAHTLLFHYLIFRPSQVERWSADSEPNNRADARCLLHTPYMD